MPLIGVEMEKEKEVEPYTIPLSITWTIQQVPLSRQPRKKGSNQ
jgi:hypothetical protein